MIYHDANVDKPPKSGTYLTFKVFEGYPPNRGKKECYCFHCVRYDKENDGWNLSREHGREYELFPDYWAEVPSYEDVMKNLKGVSSE